MSACDYISERAEVVQGDITVPGDKSISHRAIMFGAIADGTTTITGFLNSEDCFATLKAFQSLGVLIEGPIGEKVVIHGVGKYGLKQSNVSIDCGNSGTTMRLMTGILAAQPFDSRLIGDDSLMKRPMERVSRPLNMMGATVSTNDGKPPITIEGGHKLQGIRYEMPVASAQVKSCVLLAGLYAEGETTIVENGLSRDHTERMLMAFSYPIQKCDGAVSLTQKSTLKAADIIVPGDISSAAFLMVAASVIPGSDLIIRNVGINQTRTGVIQILKEMGASIDILNKRICGEEPIADIHVKHAELEGIDIPTSLVPQAIDEFPIIFIAASCAKGQTLLHGAKELRSKESDRISSMVEGLQTLGIDVQALEDGVFIAGGKLTGGVVNSYSDHRIAMAFSIAGAVASDPVKILNCEHINTSFPGFINLANEVGLKITLKKN